MKRVLVLCAFLVGTFVAVPRAHAAPRVELQLSQREVAVGDPFQVTLNVLDDTEAPHGNPKLRLPQSIVVRGQMMGPLSYGSVVNGRVTQLTGIHATFTLEATKQGTFTIGPLTITWAGKTLTSKTVTVTAGTRAARPDPWAQLRNLFDDDDAKPPPEEEFDPKLALPAALGSHAFLHATIDKETAVLGEQRTLSVFLYQDADLPSPDVLSASEPTLEGFLTKSLLPPGQEPPEVGKAKVGDRRFRVRLVRKLAIFPVSGGALKVGPMRLKIRARGNGDRASETFTVNVTEPPRQGRPGNYVLGTTGSYRADCTVEPRTTKDGILGITAKLDGYGLFPDRLPVPASQNVVFEAPEVRENLVADESGRWGGWRSFQYVAKVGTQGTVDLGEMALPFFNPATGHYETAKCALGSVKVESAAPPAAAVLLSPLLSELPKPETSLAGTPPRTADLPRALPWVFGIGPLALFGLGIVRAMPERKKRKLTPSERFREGVRSATEAAQEGRPKDAIGELERGLDAFVREKYELTLGAVDDATARESLGEKGVPETLIAELLSFRSACTNARYGTTTDVDVTPLLDNARKLGKQFS